MRESRPHDQYDRAAKDWAELIGCAFVPLHSGNVLQETMDIPPVRARGFENVKLTNPKSSVVRGQLLGSVRITTSWPNCSRCWQQDIAQTQYDHARPLRRTCTSH